jgi:probable HAF family extracellular repeat protein
MKKSLLVLISISCLCFLNGCGAASQPPPLVATHFSVTTATTSQVAGTAFNINVTALDASNAMVSTYAGTVNFASSDTQAVLPASSPLIHGTGSFSVMLKTAASQTITVIDAAGRLTPGSLNSINVSAAAASQLSITAPASANAGMAISFTVTAKDPFSNTATSYSGTLRFTSTDGQAVLPPNGKLTMGTGTFSATLNTAGSQTTTATDTVTVSITGSSNSISVSPTARATHFSVTAPASVTAGTAFNFTVTALDTSNNTVTTYAGTVHFTSIGGQAVLPANATLTNGTGTFSTTMMTVGSQTITATDTVTVSITGSSNAVSVSPAAKATHFSVTAPASVTAGTAFNFTVTALDASNNTVITYAGAIHFTSSDGQATLPANSTLTNGTATFSATPKTIGAQTITAIDTVTASITGTSNPINVSAPGTLTITSGAPPNGTVGQTYGGTFSIVENHCLATFSGWRLDATGGTSGYHWSWLAAPGSSLPPGLAVGVETYTCGGSTRCCVTVSSPPLIHGMPTAAGTYHVIVTVTVSGSPAAQASANYTIVVSNPSSAAASAMAATTPREQHTRYKLIDVGTLGGPNSTVAAPFFAGVAVASLSQKGSFVGQADTSTPDPFGPNCFNSDCYVSHAITWEDGVRTDLGALPGPAGLSSATTWISGNGLIAGFSENGEVDPFTGIQSVHGIVWKHGGILDLGTLKGGYESVANAVNNRGEVVGYANNAVPDLESLVGLGSQTRAVAWWNGEIHDLGTLGGTDAVALYVNDLGQIVGQSYTSSSVPPPTLECGDSPLTLHAFIWENGQMTDLRTLGGSCASAFALNNRGQVVGGATIAGDTESHAFLWERGVMKDLGALGGTHGYAGWLNDSGRVVGAATNSGDQALLAFSWKDGAITNLGTLNGDACSAADAINSKDQVVGGSGFYDASFFPACTDAVEHAVLWEDGKILDLNLLVSAPSDLTLNEATFINDRGEISGFGTLANGDAHAFALIPCEANHPDVEGCDYDPVEVVPELQAWPAQITPAPAVSPATSSPLEVMTRLRSSMAGRNRRSVATTTVLNDAGKLEAFKAGSAITNIEPAPTSLTSFAFKRGFYDVVELSWTDHSTDADSYHIERCSGANCTNFGEISVTGGSTTRYIDSLWPMHLTFRYRVRAHSPTGYSGYSNIRTQTTP